LSMLGLVPSLLFSNKSYKLTDDEGDSIIAVEDPYGFGTDIEETRFGFIRQYSESDLDAITKSNGTAAGRSGLFVITGGEWINNPDTNAYDYVASSAKLEPVEDLGDFAGAPLVADVHAKQIPGSKNVEVRFWLQYDSSKSSEVYIEVWFRESSSELQWERCMEIDKGEYSNILTKKFAYNSESGMNDLVIAHTRSGSGWVSFEWDAGTEKPKFKGDDCQIRVMAIYQKENPYSTGSFLPDEQQGSGWDGFERESAPIFVYDNDSTPLGINAQGAPEYDFVINYVSSNSVPRIGSLLEDEESDYYLPVWDFTSTDLEAICGTAGLTAGKYSITAVETYDGSTYNWETKLKAVIQQ
jgi:hypothetical protein